MNVNSYIDHTLLKAFATKNDIEQLCKEAEKYQFYAVCIHSSHLPFAGKLLKNSSVKLCTVIGFPLGASSSAVKIEEAKQAVKDGADEVDMVLNIGWMKEGNFNAVQEEISAIKQAIGDTVLKVILETCYLTDAEIEEASRLSSAGGADFVKTSTGFGSRGASLNDIAIMKAAINENTRIKASGGIKDHETALKFIEAGADRLGTSSGIAIVTGKSKSETDY
ncbi:deoxyribose-phosphate aldolase [Leptobacterium flavescens]|uniref:Deoxyribose-phosphate aldolase n=1 Tax=Leptobacterium flavescens TaxID=472055 RepID=A0A6P0UR56_9FLAO|nr:deoxyribose-phosphate aldolase [Leptobacterium flavescens]NER13333.1 deoxyribose-phosphate aldolase [Leptobacterium flavescens]